MCMLFLRVAMGEDQGLAMEQRKMYPLRFGSNRDEDESDNGLYFYMDGGLLFRVPPPHLDSLQFDFGLFSSSFWPALHAPCYDLQLMLHA